MPAVHSKLHTLSLLSSFEGSGQPFSYPPEREISRDALLSVAPDREDLLLNRGIEEIRQKLKLRVNPAYGHWLFCSQKRREVKLKDATTRLSVFGRLASNAIDNERAQENKNNSLRVVRRVMSASSVYSLANPASNARLSQTALDIWGGAPLSTTEKLISPRSLSATHILVIHAKVSSNPTVTSRGTLRPSRRRATTRPTFSEVIELPINDLLFILNVPNLMPPREDNFSPILPRRLHKEMPRVLMCVPHLDTFPELVVYLHTKNQAALFRNLVPEWIRDIIHPLPPVPIARNVNTAEVMPTSAYEILNVKKLLGRLVAGSSSTSSLDTLGSSVTSLLAEESQIDRSLSTIAIEIAEAAYEFDCDEDSLIHTATLLDALQDNLTHIGYFAKDLWNELEICREIIRRAISHQAKVTDEDDQE